MLVGLSREEKGLNVSTTQPFLSDVTELRRRARENIDRGAITDAYELDSNVVCDILNQALATVSTVASPLRKISGLIFNPMPGSSGAVTCPCTGLGAFSTNRGNWCAYFQ